MKAQFKKTTITFAICSILLLVPLLSGCLPIHEFSVAEVPKQDNIMPNTNRFYGLEYELNQATNRGETLRLLIAHGMGMNTIGYSTNLVDHIACKLNLYPSTNGISTNYEDGYPYTLLVRSFTNGPAKLCTYELTWSSLTEAIKEDQFAVDFQPEMILHRQIINDSIKTAIVDDALSDVVMYLGKLHGKLQLTITNAIYRMEDDSGTHDDPIAVITHSLGSYMLVDTLATMEEKGDARRARQYAHQVKQFFMLANQLPLLDLAEQSKFTPGQSPGVGVVSNLWRMKKEFSPSDVQLRDNLRSFSVDQTQPLNLEVVAFSDPNDLLSYKLRERDIKYEKPKAQTQLSPQLQLPSSDDIDAFNVTYTVEHWSLLGVLSMPEGAHVNWWTDAAVPRFLSFGCETNSQ